MSDLVSFFVFQKHSVFIPLKFVYPECYHLIHGEEKLYPLICMQRQCHRNKGCAEKLAKRVHFLFQHVVPEAEMIYAYYKYPDRPNSIRAGLFDKDLREPQVITLNRSGFRKFMKEGIAHQWNAPMEYWLIGGSDKLISVDSLIKT